jgi:hypothetical protein
MNRQVVIPPRIFGERPVAGENRECRHAFDGEGLQMIAADKDDHIRLRLIQYLPQLAHRGDRSVELRMVFILRICE